MFVSICHFHQGKARPTTVPAVVRKIHFSKGKQKNSGKKMYINRKIATVQCILAKSI